MDAETRVSFALLGVTVEMEEDEDEVFGIWRENVDSAVAFFKAATQWRFLFLPPGPVVPGRLLRTGLDHAALAAQIGFARKPGRRLRGVFDDCLAMELAALDAFAEAAP